MQKQNKTKKRLEVPSKTVLPLQIWFQSGLCGARSKSVDDLEMLQFSNRSWARIPVAPIVVYGTNENSLELDSGP